MTGIEELLSQIAELKAAVEQVADEQKASPDGPPFKILETHDRLVEFDPEKAEGGTVLLIGSAEYMSIGTHWVDFSGETCSHNEMCTRIRNYVPYGNDVILLHRG